MYNAPANSKPWIILFMRTPLSGPEADFNTYEGQLDNLIILSEETGAFNVGFADYRAHEHVFESFEFEGATYGQMVPYLVYIKDGKAYHLGQRNAMIVIVADFLANLDERAKCIEPVRPARNEVTIFFEYWKRELAKQPIVNTVFNYFPSNNQTDNLIYKNVLVPLLNNKVPIKQQGFNLIMYFIVPAVLIVLYTIYSVLCLMISCICKKNGDKSKAKASVKP